LFAWYVSFIPNDGAKTWFFCAHLPQNKKQKKKQQQEENMADLSNNPITQVTNDGSST